MQVLLAIQSGPNGSDTSINGVNVPDVLFNSIFFVEFVLKVIAFGLYGTGRFAYLRSSWNIGDLVILAGSVAGMINFGS